MSINPDEILARFGGTTINDLNNVLNVSEDANPDDDISTLSLTHFIATRELANYLKSHRHEFTILSLNVQSIRAKFDQLSVVLSTLYRKPGSVRMMTLLSFFYLVTVWSTRANPALNMEAFWPISVMISHTKYQISTTMHHLGKVYLSMFLVSNCINKFILVISTVLLKITIIIKV